jgi:hypothetical protein
MKLKRLVPYIALIVISGVIFVVISILSQDFEMTPENHIPDPQPAITDEHVEGSQDKLVQQGESANGAIEDSASTASDEIIVTTPDIITDTSKP